MSIGSFMTSAAVAASAVAAIYGVVSLNGCAEDIRRGAAAESAFHTAADVAEKNRLALEAAKADNDALRTSEARARELAAEAIEDRDAARAALPITPEGELPLCPTDCVFVLP